MMILRICPAVLRNVCKSRHFITSKFSPIPFIKVTHLDSAQNKIERNQWKHSGRHAVSGDTKHTRSSLILINGQGGGGGGSGSIFYTFHPVVYNDKENTDRAETCCLHKCKFV
jgi:hypothetical protein